jgi:hypothetical protein
MHHPFPTPGQRRFCGDAGTYHWRSPETGLDFLHLYWKRRLAADVFLGYDRKRCKFLCERPETALARSETKRKAADPVSLTNGPRIGTPPAKRREPRDFGGKARLFPNFNRKVIDLRPRTNPNVDRGGKCGICGIAGDFEWNSGGNSTFSPTEGFQLSRFGRFRFPSSVRHEQFQRAMPSRNNRN